MNKITVIGNLTRDPEEKVMSTGNNVVEFTVAVTRKYKNKDGIKETDFFSCQAWSKLGDIVKQYAHKGKKVCVVGEMQCSKYTDKDGNNRTMWRLNAEEVELLSKDSEEGESASTQSAPARSAKKEESKEQFDFVPDFGDEELPF